MKRFFSFFSSLVVISLLFGCVNSDKGDNTMTSANVIKGESIVSELIEKNYNQLYSQFSDELKQIVTLKDFETLADQFMADETNFSLVSRSNVNDYEIFVWHNDSVQKGITASIDAAGIIHGIQVLYLNSHPETDTLYSEVVYDLPFNDEWYVFWGGHTALLNYHYEYDHIRYAYDFIKIVDGQSYHGDPLKNESYYAFDVDILAPADGKVIKVVNHIEDNIPGQFNEQFPEGNMVVIEHEFNEYSLIAHFKQHSIVVQEGDTVTKGQLLGKTGNSGYSSEAHIHYQVNKKLDNNTDIVIPITFSQNKQWVRGEFARNE